MSTRSFIKLAMLLMVLMSGIENCLGFNWVRDYKIGNTFTVSTRYHSSTHSINWDYDPDVVQPISGIGQATSSVTFKVIGTTLSSGSIINAVTYYWVTVAGRTGLFQYMDDWKIYVEDNNIVTLDKNSLELDVRESATLTASLSNPALSTKFKWSSSNTSVATVSGSSAKAVVNAIATGRATIKVTIDNGSYAECEVVVGGAPDPNKFTVTANPKGGVVSQGTIVKLTSSIEGATIYFTTDGSTPTEDSNYYLSRSGVTLKESCTLKAIAVKWENARNKYSEVMSETYTMKEEPGYLFSAKTSEGVNMFFQVKRTSPKECIVFPEDPKSYRYAISTATSGVVTIPSKVNGYTVVGIGEQAFCSCSYLTRVEIPNTVISIENSAFSGCYNLSNIVLPNNLQTLGRYAFQHCSSLTSVNIPSNVSSIGEVPFFECNALTVISVDNDNPYYDSRDDCNAIIKTATNTLIEGIATTIIPESVTSIAERAFAYCNISTVSIPSKVTTIGNSAFYQCDNLESLTLGKSVKSIGKFAFSCSSLTQVTTYISEPFDISDDVFKNAPSATLYVPLRTKNKYESTAGWKEFKEIIEFGDDPNKTDIVVTATSYSRQYGEPNPVFEYVVTGGTIQGRPVISCAASENSEVGTYKITLSQGTISENVKLVNGVLSIEKAPLVITANSYKIPLGGSLPIFSATYSGFKNNETETVLTKAPVFTCTATQASDPGNYEIRVSDAEAHNYSIEYVHGILTILSNTTMDEVSVHVHSAGSLSLELGNTEWNSVKSLTASGQINGTDICLIRKMLQEGKLTELNLCDAKIVSGGDSYDISGLSKTSENVIGESMFYNCRNLKKIVLPSSTQRIDGYAFFGCSSLKQIDIPDACVSVGDYAIAFCDSVSIIALPGDIVKIGNSAFTYCTSLSTIYSGIEDVNDVVRTDYYSSPFEGIADDCIWHVKKGTKKTYKNQAWWDNSWGIIEDWVPSCVNAITNDQKISTSWYSIDGKRLEAEPSKPGLYIHNGQMIMVK